MKKQIQFLAATALIVPVVSFGTVFAVDATTSTTSTNGTSTGTTTSTTNTTTSTTTLSAQEKQDLEKRLQNRTAQMKTKLTAVQQQRIAAKCKNAQLVLGNVGKKVDTIQADRTKAYGGIVAHLSTLIDKLKALGTDTTTLQSQLDSLKAKVATYDADFAVYKQAVSDLSVMACTQDPTSFQASLDAARATLATVRSDATAIHDFVKNTIRPTLDTLKKQLEQTTKTTSGSN